MTWYIARSGGILTYLLLSTSVVVGVAMSARARVRWPRFAVEEVHRFLAILTGVFVALHGGALLLDKVVPTSLTQVVVPFGTSYRPFAVGLGVVAAELMAAVGISNLLRKRLPYRLWRRIHYLTIVVWLAATAHGLLAGTDRADSWFLALTAAAACAVALAFLVRFAKTSELPAIAGLAVATVVAVLGLAFTPQAKSHSAVAKGIPSPYEAPVTARVVASSGDPLVSVVGNAGAARQPDRAADQSQSAGAGTANLSDYRERDGADWQRPAAGQRPDDGAQYAQCNAAGPGGSEQ